MPKPDRACALNCRGHLCRADDRQCLPVCSDLTCSCVSVLLQCWEWRQLKISFLYHLLGVFPQQVFWKINLYWDKQRLWAEWRNAHFRNWSRGQKSEINIRVHLILLWLCLSWDCTAPSKQIHSTEEQVWRPMWNNSLCIYCPNVSPVLVEAAQHVLVWCSLAHRAPLSMGLYWGKYAAWVRVASGTGTRGTSILDAFWKWL